MKSLLSKIYLTGFTIIAILSSLNLSAQLSGVKTIPGDYATITVAVTALNTAGVGTGGVTFNIIPGYTETISSTISLTATGTAANPIIFQKDPGTGGANPVITSYTGGTGTPATAVQDGIWRMIGSDYVTIDGINLTENPANTTNPATMEYGYALYKASLSNGCQNVTITNCVITLSNINNDAGTAPMINGSVGILMINTTATAAITNLVPTTAAGTNSSNSFYSNTIQKCNTGIALIGYAAASPFIAADQNNDIGGNASSTANTILNFGGAPGAINPASGIRTLAQYELNVSNNILNSNNGGGANHENILRGIYINTAASANATITNNTITVKGGGTTQTVTAIENASGSTAVGNEVNISNNTITGCSYSSATTGGFYGIYNIATPAILNLNGNTLNNNSTAAMATGPYYSIWNNGAATTIININDNSINGVIFAAATACNFYGIYNQTGGSSSALSISSNNIKNINYAALSTGVNVYIINSAATLSQFISSNTFTNISVNTTGAVTFISNNVAVSATGNQVVDDNSIDGSFTRQSTATSGALTLFLSTATSVAGSSISNSNNDFSNINVSGASSISGWINTDAGASSKTIQGNIFSNWTGGTGSVIALSVNLTGTLNATVANLISNISSAGSITGISTIAGNDNIYSNTISNLTSTGSLATIVTGIAVGAGTTKNIYLNAINGLTSSATTGSVNGITVSGSTTVNVFDNTISGIAGNAGTTGSINGIWMYGGAAITAYRNKIYNLSTSSSALTTGVVNGIQVSGTTASAVFTLRNNLIGDLKATAASAADVVRGISLISTGLTSNLNVYYNTIHINATSTGTNFGTTGIYHTASSTATTAQLDMRNNIIHNVSVARGTGLTVAYRRSNANLANYASTSNNNLFYAGVPAATSLIYYDVTNSDQLLAAYITRMATRDAASVSESLLTGNKFLSTTGTSDNFLHMDDSKASAVKGGAANVSGITSDFDNDIRQGNLGYSGTGSAPDIGADEYAGITYIPLAGNYNVGTGEIFTSLTNAGGLFAKINRVGLSGNVVVQITSDLTEMGTEGLKEWIETGAGSYSVTIQTNNTTSRLISGDVLSGMIRLNGADRVTIDGGATKALIFRNTNTAGTTATAFSFLNGASNNNIRNCSIEAYTNATNGVILFSTSATYDGGNSNNLIESCNINATVAGNNGTLCILSAGTNVSGFENANNTIKNNNLYNYRDRGLEIKSTGSFGWIISGNSLYNGGVSGSITYASGSTLHGIRILGGSGYLIANNFIGGSAAQTLGSTATYATSTGNFTYQGILLNSIGDAATPSIVKGNKIANFSISTYPAAASSATFYGIETNGSNINIGGSASGEGNLVGSNSANGSISVTTSTIKTTNTSFIRGIYCNSRDGLISGNQVGGFDINNIGSLPAASTFIGIYINNPSAPALISNNIIGSDGGGAATNSIRVLNTSTATATSLYGISVGTAVGSTLAITGNLIKNISHLSGATVISAGGIIGINMAARSTAEISVLNNSFENNTTPSTATTALFYGVQNTGASGTIRIIGNTFKGNTINSAATLFSAIRNTGAVFNEIEISSNNIGTEATPLITFAVASSGAHLFINNTGGAPTSSLTIANNIIQNINYSVNGTGANTFISNTAATLYQFISANTFTNLNVQTSGNITFIANNVIVPNGGSQTISNNSILGSFGKRTGGTVTFTTSSAISATGSSINIINNNISNITVTGATIINGIVNTDAGNSSKTIQGNYFTNWSAATGAITALNVNISSATNSIFGNVIRNLSGASTVIGITSAAGNDNINNNTIDSLYTSGGTTTTVTGINISSGTAKNIYKNTVSNLWGTANSTGSVRGILVSGGSLINVYQNTISTIYGNAITTGSISGIWVTGGANVSVSRNKIYDLFFTSASTTGAVYGVQVSGAVANLSCSISSNMIGDLKAPAASNADAIRGIGVISTGLTSNINVYYNTIYINATSTGTNFGTTGIYHSHNATATTAVLDLRNNSVTNISTPKGTGRAVAYRRSGTNLSNYASTSNNNMLYAGTASTVNLLFFDNTNSDQTIAAFKSRVAARETASITEDLVTDLKFFSTAGSSLSFLHINPNKLTALRGGGAQIPGFIDDYDGDIRFGNAGYSGNGSAPDIGADEFAGLQYLPFEGIVYVGTGQNFTSLTNSNGLFSKMNSLGFSGNVTVNITSDLAETGAEALNQWTETGAGNYFLTIQPDATTTRLISGNALPGLIRLNGADKIRIDGGSGKNLIFRNTNTSGTTGTAFSFINGATYDTLRNCTIEAYANAANGVILLGTAASAATGNSYIIINDNNINGTVAGNSSNTGIYSSGTPAKVNANISILNNNIYDFRDRAIEVTATGSTLWSITGNSLYNGSISAAVNYDAASVLHGIRVLGGAGYVISNNFIGGNGALATGANAVYSSTLGNVSYKAIVLATSSASPASVIKGNTIRGLTINMAPQSAGSTAFMGIETTGSGINVGGAATGEGNTIGSNSINGAINIVTSTSSSTATTIITGINFLSAGGEVIGNQTGGFNIENKGSDPAPSFFKGININNATAASKVDNNIVGSYGSGAATQSIQVLPTSTAAGNVLTGIEFGSSVTSAIQADGNKINNFANLSTISSGVFTGINNVAAVLGASMSITNSSITNINSAATTDAASGIYSGIISTSPSTISNDTISNITQGAAGALAQVRGIYVSGAFAHAVYNNWLLNISSASSKTADAETGTPVGYTITGILNGASVTGQLIYGNTLYNFSSTSAEAVNTTIAGIAVVTTGNSGSIYRNRISSFTNTATGASPLPGITGIMGFNGSYNVYNNSINIDNGTNANGVKVFGINHATSNAWNYFFNTIKIGGSALATATRSAGFIRTVNGAVSLKNNNFVNERSGVGNHFAISNKVANPATNWSAATGNYNNIYSSDSAFAGEWGNGGFNSFIQWKANNDGDQNSISNSVSFVSSLYDLMPDGRSNCNLHNAGTPVASPVAITTDLAGTNRHATTPDLGAYEFNYISFVVTATSNGPVCVGSMVELYSNSGEAIVPAYSWSGVDSTDFSSDQNTTSTAVNGYYTIKVTDINGCMVTDSTLVSLTPVPNAAFSYTAETFCPGADTATINFSGTVGGTFTSLAGLTINAATAGINLSTSSPGSYTVTYTVAPFGGCNQFQVTAPVAINSPGTWTGAVSTDFNTGANWLCGYLPLANSIILIPAGLSNYPQMSSGSAAVKDITIGTGASLTILNGSIQVSGVISNNGIFTSTGGSIEFNGSSAQYIPANLFAGNTIKALAVNNTSGVTLAGELNITENVIISNGALNTGDSLVLKSSANGTARIGQITSAAVNPVNGKVTVERYIQGRRKYRLITSSVTTSAASALTAGMESLSIWGNWQNSGSNVAANSGTYITGGAAADGFDQQTATASFFTYHDSLRKYIGFTTANAKNTKYTPLKAGVAYYMFVYGDRKNTITTTTPNATVLKARGNVLTGDQLYSTSSAIPLSNVTGRFTLVGNPYASSIDWASITKNNISNTHWGWDPNLGNTGGYVTVSCFSGITLISPLSESVVLNQYIQPGQGFFVQTTDASPQMTIREQDKADENKNNAFRANGDNDMSLLAVNLLYANNGANVLADGMVAAYSSNFSNTANSNDAIKITSSTEAIGIPGPELLSIETRQFPLHNDTLKLNVLRLTKAQYTLQIFAKNMNGEMQPYLVDKYLQTSTALSVVDTNYVKFTVLTNVAASYDANRFCIVFKQSGVLPVKFTNVNAVRKENTNLITWDIAQEQGIIKYEIEHSTDGTNFYPKGEVRSKGQNALASYAWIDTNPSEGLNYYRVKAIQNDGNTFTSKVVLVRIENIHAGISIYPNPVVSQKINLLFKNISKGVYSVVLFDARGIMVYKDQVVHAGGSFNYSRQILQNLATGAYIFRITNGEINYSIKVQIE